MIHVHQISDDDPIIRATSAITTGNIGRLNSAVYDLQAFAKRADSLLATIDALNARIDALEAEKPPQPRIYREAAK